MGMRRSFKPTNLAQNGDFSSGVAGWSNTASIITASDNVLTVTGNGGANYPLAYQNTPKSYTSGNKLYIRSLAMVTNSVCTKLDMNIRGSSTTGTLVRVIANTPTQNAWHTLSDVVTIPADGTGFVQLSVSHYYADAATANGKVMKAQVVLCSDLTSLFGAGNEPTKAWCDLNIPTWFDGTLSRGSMGGIGGLK